jgi:GT2 family glycosyltransferase
MGEVSASKPAAVIGYLHGEYVRAEFAASMLALTHHSRDRIGTVLTVESGPNLSRSRNELAARFLVERREPWLLMVDTDMVFAPDALDRLLEAADQRARPILGGLCFSRGQDGPLSTMYEIVPHEDGAGTFARLQQWPEDTPHRVSATGAAFLLVHRYVFERLAKHGWGQPAKRDRVWPWFRESAMGTRVMGEDLTFCLRAAAAGYPTHVHTGVQIGHMKSAMLGKVT